VRAPDLGGRRVVVVGLARSGVAAARLLAREGARVTVTDLRTEAELGPALQALAGLEIRRALGGHREAGLASADLVVLSPGVPGDLPELGEARRRGVPIWAEVELGARLLGATPVVAITGTNGKSTTAALCGALFAADRPTFTGGNLGTPLCAHVLSGERAEVAVLELSSFQIEGVRSLRPRVAAILNVTPDHLDRYRDVEDYAAAKARLFALQGPGDAAVANARDDRAVSMASASRGTLHTFGFGPAAPRAARDPGGEPAADGATEIWIRTDGGGAERFVLRNRALRGRHNRENAMAAALCARLLGVPGERVQRGLDGFGGLPHRLEVVSERGGVEWVNDSKATNVDSTLVGLSAFPAGAPRVILIMGGRGKGAPYAPLRDLFGGRVKVLLTIGEDGPAVGRELGDLAPTEACGDLPGAIRRAAALAAPGDVVLLSPACASYDQFRSYEERGAAFRRLVEDLA
jgi:UDP-N-acetylmuramoylalanine--D-glutamate ligase